MSKIENKWLLEDLIELTVANFYAYDKKTGIEYYSGTLKSHELDAKGDNTKVKAGQQNDIFYVIPKSKELSLKITDIFSRQDMMALKFGGNISEVGTELVDARHMPRNYTLKNDGTSLYIELSNEPKAGEEVKAYNNATKRTISNTEFTVDATNKKKYIVTSAGLVEGETIFVTGFKYKAKATDLYSNINSDSRMPEMEVVIDVPVFDQTCMDIVMHKQYIFPRAMMNSSITTKSESEKKEVNDDTTIDILKDNSVDYLGRIVYIYADGTTTSTPISDLVATSTVIGQADLTFSSLTDMDDAIVEYKLSSDVNWAEVNVGGSTGIRMAIAIKETDISKTVLGLTAGSTYDLRLRVEDGLHAGISNISTIAITTSVPISNLAVTSTVAGKADMTFASSADATTVVASYRLNSATPWTVVPIATTGTGVRMTPTIAPADTTAQIINLATGNYDFLITVTNGSHAGDSNIVLNVAIA